MNIFQKNVSFDYHFSTDPNATNSIGQRFTAAPSTPAVNGLSGAPSTQLLQFEDGTNNLGARVLNRLGLPLGQSYLDSASRLMRATILPAAEELRWTQPAALGVPEPDGLGPIRLEPPSELLAAVLQAGRSFAGGTNLACRVVGRGP